MMTTSPPVARLWPVLVCCSLALSAGTAVLSAHDRYGRLSLLMFAMALVVLVVAAILRDSALGVRHWRVSRLDLLLMAGLTLSGLALRLYRLDDFLPPVHGDEGEMGMLALLAGHGPEPGMPPLPFFKTAWLGHPTLFYHLQAAALLLFGDSVTGLRILSAAFGALSIPLAYLIGLTGWSRIAAVTAAWLMAVSHLYIQYSRIALNNIETLWFTLLFVLMFAVLYEAGRKTSDGVLPEGGTAGLGLRGASPLLPAAVAGLAAGLGQYFYFGSRLMIVMSVPLIAVLLWRKRLALAQLFIFASAIVVACLPLAVHYIMTWPTFLERMRGVNVLSAAGLQHNLGAQSIWPDDLPELAAVQIYRNLGFFTGKGDVSAFYLASLPAFDFVTLVLGWLGLLFAIAHCRRFHEMALLIWLGLGIVLGGVLTNDSPNGPRLIVAAAGLFVLAGIALHHLHRYAVAYSPQAARAGLPVLGAILAGMTGYLNFQIYFVDYARMADNGMPIHMAHDIARDMQRYSVHVLGAPEFYAGHGTIRLVARDSGATDLDGGDIASLRAEFDAGKHGSKGLMFIILPARMADFPLLTAAFPGGSTEERRDFRDSLLYTLYRTPVPEGATEQTGQNGGNSP